MMNNRNEHYLIPTSNKDLQQQQHYDTDKEQEQDDGQDVNNDVVDHGYDDHVEDEEEEEEGDNVVVVNNGEDDKNNDHHHYIQLGYSPFHHVVHNNSNDDDCDDNDHYTEDDNGKDSQEFTRITMLQPQQQLLLQVGGSSSVVLVRDDDIIITTPGTGTTTTTTAPTTTTTADNYHLYTCITNPPFYYKHYNDDQSDSDYDETQSHEEIFYADGSSSCRQVSQQQDDDDQHDSGNDVVVHDDGDDDYTTTQQDVDNTHDGILLDFHSLAQQALQSLDSEYFNTVMPSVGGNRSTVSRRGENGSCFDYFENDNGNGNNDDDDRITVQEENVETVTTTTDSHLLTTTTTKQELQQQTVQTTLLDTAAISKAMNNIALSCHSIQEKFSKWKPSHCSYTPFSVPSLHPIIPHKALLAFQRLTKKAQFTTANWTRSATLAEAISRIFLGKEMDCVLHDPQEQEQGQHQDDLYFVIHCIGADHVECQSRENIVNMFQPIVKWIHGYQPNLFEEKGTKQQENTSSFEVARHLRIELLGPNVPLHSQDFGVMNLLPNNVPGKLESATVICKNCMYHDYIVEMMTENKKNHHHHRRHGHYHYPSMIIAYNAGIWGYTDWHPTLKSLCNMNIMTRPVPFVITAYTIYEAEDDAQVLDEVLQEEWKASTSHNGIMIPTAMDAKSRCLWSAELNPYASRVVRETKSSDNIYHENGAWQAYLMGKITDVE